MLTGFDFLFTKIFDAEIWLHVYCLQTAGAWSGHSVPGFATVGAGLHIVGFCQKPLRSSLPDMFLPAKRFCIFLRLGCWVGVWG